MIDRDAILALIPHAGAMCLLDAVEHWDAGVARCLSRSHRDAQNPLRADGQLSALNLVEYAAQAMAVHGGLLAQAEGRAAAPGMLTSVRGLQLGVQRIDQIEAPLRITVIKRLAGAAGWLYDFEVSADDVLLASGRLSVMPMFSEAAPHSA